MHRVAMEFKHLTTKVRLLPIPGGSKFSLPVLTCSFLVPLCRWAFDLPNPASNPLKNCSDEEAHPTIDLRLWRQRPAFSDDGFGLQAASFGPEQQQNLFVKDVENGLFKGAKVDDDRQVMCDIEGRIVKLGEAAQIGACTKCTCNDYGNSLAEI